MTRDEMNLKYCMDALPPSRDKRKYQIILRGESKPFFSSENEQRWREQIKRLDNLIAQGKGTAYTAYENGKAVRSQNGMQVAIQKEYAKRMRKD